MELQNNNDEEERVNRPACAACKRQRKKCTYRKCILHTIFPATEPEVFSAVHKLFGISNVIKIMSELTTQEDRIEAARALKHEAMLRKIDPILGASGVIARLNSDLKIAREENKNLSRLLQQLLPLPMHYQHVPVNPHMNTSSSSGYAFGNTQQHNVLVSSNYVQVIQNNGILANKNDVSQSHSSSRNQESGATQDFGAPHGVEYQYQNFQNQEISQGQEISQNQEIENNFIDLSHNNNFL